MTCIKWLHEAPSYVHPPVMWQEHVMLYVTFHTHITTPQTVLTPAKILTSLNQMDSFAIQLILISQNEFVGKSRVLIQHFFF